jgi:hypothetical protein
MESDQQVQRLIKHTTEEGNTYPILGENPDYYTNVDF